MSGNQYATLAGSAVQTHGGGPRSSTRKQRGGGVAGSALRRAGLVDEDLGMRDLSSAGPSRGARGRGRQAETAIGAQTGDARTPTKGRARANPMGSRPARGSQDPAVNGQAFGIRGAGSRGGSDKRAAVPLADVLRGGGGTGKGKGRVPGGAGGGGAADASLLARLETNEARGGSAKQGHTTGQTINALKRFLRTRFDQNAQFLNLEGMATDATLAREAIKPPGVVGAHKDIGSVLWKLCKELFPNTITLSLAKNDFKSLSPVATLPEFLPNLKNLSLEGNDLKWVRDLHFNSHSRGPQPKFNGLHELILTGNPIHDNAVSAGNEQGYRSEVLARFPDLHMLDMKPVSQAEQGFAQLPGGRSSKDQVGFAQGAANAGVEVRDFPLSIPHGNFVDEHAERIVPPFLAKYFDLFDKERDSLRNCYSASATLTVVTAFSIPPRARSAGFINTMPRQRDLNWKAQYKDISSHNVMQFGTRPGSKGLVCGQPAIISTLNRLPKSTHPLTDASKFAFDAWLLPNTNIGASMSLGDGSSTKPDALLFISVHGEFNEAPSQGVRSFSRCFIVAPVVPGSQAAQLGWPCVILSDQLTVRHYLGSSAWDVSAAAPPAGNVPGAPGPAVVAPAVASGTPSNGASAVPGLTPEQNSLCAQLSAQTGLTLPFAVQCLSENSWNPQLAMERFQALKASGAIPSEAFIQAAA